MELGSFERSVLHLVCHLEREDEIQDSNFVFNTAPSFEAWETHRYLKSRYCQRPGRGLLDEPYAPCHPPSVPPVEEHLVGHLTNYCHQMSSRGLYILFFCLKLTFKRSKSDEA